MKQKQNQRTGKDFSGAGVCKSGPRESVSTEQTLQQLPRMREDIERGEKVRLAKHELGMLVTHAVGARTVEEVTRLAQVLCQTEVVIALSDVVMASTDIEKAQTEQQEAWRSLVGRVSA